MTDESLDLALKDWASVTVAPEIDDREAERVIGGAASWQAAAVPKTPVVVIAGILAACMAAVIPLVLIVAASFMTRQIHPTQPPLADFPPTSPSLLHSQGNVDTQTGIRVDGPGWAIAEVGQLRIAAGPDSDLDVFSDGSSIWINHHAGDFAFQTGPTANDRYLVVQVDGGIAGLAEQATFAVLSTPDGPRVEVVSGVLGVNPVRDIGTAMLQPGQAWTLSKPSIDHDVSTEAIEALLKPAGMP